jgi:hypothetical protein
MGERVKHLWTDGRGEYSSNVFEAWMHAEGIQHQKTKANLSVSNGVAEHAIRTLNNCQRMMHANADLPDKYWGYVILHTGYLWNVTPKCFLDGKMLEEIFSGRIPDISHLQTFGCKAWVCIPDDKCMKLQACSIECTYLGFALNRKAHVLVQCATRKILTSCNVMFNKGTETCQQVIIQDMDDEGDALEEVGVPEPMHMSDPEPPEPSTPEDEPNEPSETKDKPESTPKPPALCRSTRTTRVPECYGAAQQAVDPKNEHTLTVAMEALPQLFKEAMSRPDVDHWMATMVKEIKLITKHEVWRRMEQPDGKNIVKCQWVFAYKCSADGKILRYKAHLVARGFSQQPGVDFGEISSLVAASDAYCILLSLVASKDLERLQLDIKTVFLHGMLDKEIYMEQPEGFSDKGDYIWWLVKALYGLKQATCAFYMCLKAVLEAASFSHIDSDHAILVKRNGDALAIILAHVDDMLLTGHLLSFLETVKADLSKLFELVNLGKAKIFVGMEIEHNRVLGTLKISQRRYIDDILCQFDMQDCKSCDTPMAEAIHLPKLDAPTIDRMLYQCIIGSLMYAMISMHPNITFATGLLTQHTTNLGDEHWNAAKRVLCYRHVRREFSTRRFSTSPGRESRDVRASASVRSPKKP